MSMNINELLRGGILCLSKAGLAIGSTATGISIAAPNGAGVDYAVGGTMYHKADAATAAITAADEQAVDTKCLYLICLNAAGTVSSVKGDEILTTDLTAGNEVLRFPVPLVDTCPIGAIMVTTVAVTFTAGTTDLDASGVTTTYQDLLALPASPRTA